MSDEQNLTVLRCQLCSKPFNKESTLKRHGYYCRSRNGATRTIRSRSCVACAKAKARCNNKLPRCSRCTLKNLNCQVIGRNSTSAAQPSTVTEPIGHRIENEPSGTPFTEAVGLFTTAGKDLASNNDVPIDFAFTDFDEGHVEWDLISVAKPSSSTTHLPDTHQQPHDLMDPLTFHNPTTQTGYGIYTSPTSLPHINSISTMPTYDLRSFTQRSAIKGSATTTAMLIVRILTSYPVMLQDSKSPPPFIHPSFLSDDEDASMESLTTCASLMRMLGSGGHASKSLLWKNVRLECERLQVQWPDLDAWELLSSMQALLIYMLIRLQEGETAYNNFDVLLLSTMWVVGCAMNNKIGNFDCHLPYGLSYGATHKDWIFEESRRRLALTFRTIGLLFSTEPAGACVVLQGLLIAPLPAHKQLWEARDETQWIMGRSRDVRGDSVFGIKPGGQMAKLNKYPPGLNVNDFTPLANLTEGESNTNWQEWCLGMDGLGALVMLAASLPIQ